MIILILTENKVARSRTSLIPNSDLTVQFMAFERSPARVKEALRIGGIGGHDPEGKTTSR